MRDDQDDAVQDAGHAADKKTHDLGGRRRRVDRRSRTTAARFPERRWLRHRRGGGDRRSFPFFNPRTRRERREAFRERESGEDE